jgi:hypothetical protein
MDESNINTEVQDGNSDVCDSDDPELGFEDHDDNPNTTQTLEYTKDKDNTKIRK